MSIISQWTQLNSEFGVSISKFRNTGNDLFVISDGQISKSIDMAESWVKVEYPNNCSINDILYFNNCFYLATDYGVYKSCKEGSNWSDRSFGLDIKNIAELEYHDSIIFAIDYYDGLYLSIDKGDTWLKAKDSVFRGIKANYFFKNGNRLYLRTLYSNNIYVWDIDKFIEIPNTNYTDYYSTDGVVSMYNDRGTIYKSTDNGKTKIPIKLNVSNAQLEFKDNLFYVYSSQILVSKDYGVTWDNYTEELNLDKKPIKYIFFDSVVFVATNSGVYKSNLSNDKSWYSKNKGLSNLEVKMLANANNSLFISPKGKLLYSSINRGDTWSKLEKGFLDKGDFNDLVMIDSALLVSNSYGVFRSDNNGKEWTNVFSDHSVNQLYNHKGKVYAATKEGVIISDDIGKSWKIIDIPAEQFSITVSGSNIISIGQDGIYFSYNEGITWLKVKSGYNYKRTKTYDDVVFTFGKSTLLKSTDNGGSWASIDSKVINENSLEINDLTKVGDYYLVSTNKGFYKTDSLFTKWIQFNEGISSLPILCRSDSNIYSTIIIKDKLYASTAKNFILERQLEKDEVVSIRSASTSNIPFLYPNPIVSGSLLNIYIADTFARQLTIELYDLYGRLFSSETVESPCEKIEYKLNNINSGIYFIKVKSEKYIFNDKLLVY